MNAPPDDRVRALAALGWPRAQAEWLALVCLHGGVFLRAQFCRHFAAPPVQAYRFVRTLGVRGVAVEHPWPWDSRRRVCRIVSRRLYRAAAGSKPPRRDANPEWLCRRLLILDYVLEHRALAWVPTVDEQVQVFEALGIDRAALPQRAAHGEPDRLPRYFPAALPIAVETGRATFVYVAAGGTTNTGLRTWGRMHAALWRALRQRRTSVRAVIAGWEPAALARAEKLLRRWTAPAADIDACEPGPALAALREAIGALDTGRLAACGGLNEAIRRCALLEAEAAAAARRVACDTYDVWRSPHMAAWR